MSERNRNVVHATLNLCRYRVLEKLGSLLTQQNDCSGELLYGDFYETGKHGVKGVAASYG
jgi:hypothetical protein